MTKILAIGDLHGNTSLAEKFAKQAKDENVDLVILAGDITLAEKSIENLIGPFTREKKTILLIPGNHESNLTVELLTMMYSNAKNIHGYSFTKDDIGIFGAGTAHIGPNAIDDEDIFELLKKSHEKIKDFKKKIMVTHIHPMGSKAEFSGWSGSKAVTKAIKKFKPDILISAHIHEAEGIEEIIGKTRVLQVGRRGTIFEI